MLVNKIINALQKKLGAVQADTCQPISHRNIAYEAGRRIGVTQGMRLALQEINSVLSDDAKEDNDL